MGTGTLLSDKEVTPHRHPHQPLWPSAFTISTTISQHPRGPTLDGRGTSILIVYITCNKRICSQPLILVLQFFPVTGSPGVAYRNLNDEGNDPSFACRLASSSSP